MNDLMIRQYEGVDVFFLEDGWFNATLVASRCGKDADRWIRSDDAFRYGRALAKSLNLLNPPPTGINETIHFIENQSDHEKRRGLIPQFLKLVGLIKTRRGSIKNGGGTWMHPKLGVKFGRWLSVEFELWCDENIQQILIQRANPQSALTTMVPHWLFNFPVVDHATDVRFKGTRNTYMSMLSRLEFRAPIYKQYITDMVNEILMGHKAKPFRRMFRIPAGSRRRTRLYVDGNLRTAMQTVESIASDRIQREGVSRWVDIQRVVAEVARTVRGDFLRRGLDLVEHVPNIRQRPLTSRRLA